MITQDELNALGQLLQRTPMSAAEAQWTQAFLMRLQAQLAQRARAMHEAQGSKQQTSETQQADNAKPDITTEALSGRTRSATGEN